MEIGYAASMADQRKLKNLDTSVKCDISFAELAFEKSSVCTE